MKDGTSIPHQLKDCGIVLGTLLVAPPGLRLRLEEDQRRAGLQVTTLHPQFALHETRYLQTLVLTGIRKRVEGLHRALDAALPAPDHASQLLTEVTWMKEVVATQWLQSVEDEVQRIRDFMDVLTSRLLECARPQVVEVVKIED